jgi:hypothetical protein
MPSFPTNHNFVTHSASMSNLQYKHPYHPAPMHSPSMSELAHTESVGSTALSELENTTPLVRMNPHGESYVSHAPAAEIGGQGTPNWMLHGVGTGMGVGGITVEDFSRCDLLG